MATTETIGKVMVDVLRERLLSINPSAQIIAIHEFFTAETADSFHLDTYDYIIDAIDSLKDKALLILMACQTEATFFSSMGAALKLDPTHIKIAEFWKSLQSSVSCSRASSFRMPSKFVSVPKPSACLIVDQRVGIHCEDALAEESLILVGESNLGELR